MPGGVLTSRDLPYCGGAPYRSGQKHQPYSEPQPFVHQHSKLTQLSCGHRWPTKTQTAAFRLLTTVLLRLAIFRTHSGLSSESPSSAAEASRSLPMYMLLLVPTLLGPVLPVEPATLQPILVALKPQYLALIMLLPVPTLSAPVLPGEPGALKPVLVALKLQYLALFRLSDVPVLCEMLRARFHNLGPSVREGVAPAIGTDGLRPAGQDS
ncbi:hypothetical protein V5799_029804 [Amblyomma americanum]|uniref:Uncharacterized protein n=1 Tax=Amblyomma americanum TaxID=6943 RepID=A0AAQ4EQ67_AMBAM